MKVIRGNAPYNLFELSDPRMAGKVVCLCHEDGSADESALYLVLQGHSSYGIARLACLETGDVVPAENQDYCLFPHAELVLDPGEEV